ncbi:class I SAM-dependent methyltransferase [Kineococcus rhizosphaerae]|uniref:Methyltransferase family protein n=1 Tax=Kineococcus rhizosphaerae TaxID=559628 RepID=A0A2T0RB45_9ACTN|nr:class I SAM-dependent methyltransferase [Kineococcus rhizosphaerae]PRY18396.1 methyltransferase family protein [Kineococcus rhizosphaerae]
MPGPGHFDAHAAAYDRGRPPYPPALWERLRPLVRRGTRVVDLGAGTGLATGPLLAAGAAVTAVEPGPALADLLRARFPTATVLRATAETADLPEGGFDLAVAATAVHWFDLDAVLPRLHRALVAGGCFAVWRTAFGDPGVPLSPFRRRVAEITAARSAPPRPGPGELDTGQWAARLTCGGWFTVRAVEEFAWSVELGTEQVRDLFTTFSDWSAHEVALAADAVRDLGGSVTEHYRTPLVLLDR